MLLILSHMWPVPLIKTISDHDTHKPHTHTQRLREGKSFLMTCKRMRRHLNLWFWPASGKSLQQIGPTLCHPDQLMKMKPKIAVFTDTNISHQLFSRFALGNSPKAEQPTPVPQEKHVQREHHLLSVNQRWVLGWMLFVLLSMIAAYIVGGLLRNVNVLLLLVH